MCCHNILCKFERTFYSTIYSTEKLNDVPLNPSRATALHPAKAPHESNNDKTINIGNVTKGGIIFTRRLPLLPLAFLP